jgi:hypothetical protein
MKLNRFVIVFAAAMLGSSGFSSIAYAQYIWLDEKGTKHYSDTPPPVSIPLKNILKQQGFNARTLPEAAAEPAKDGARPASAEKEKDAAPMTTAEKNADFQKRRAEQAEKDRKAAEEAKMAAYKEKQCEQARDYQKALQSAVPLARTDKNGERYFLSEEQRAKEAQEAKRVLDACK